MTTPLTQIEVFRLTKLLNPNIQEGNAIKLLADTLFCRGILEGRNVQYHQPSGEWGGFQLARNFNFARCMSDYRLKPLPKQRYFVGDIELEEPPIEKGAPLVTGRTYWTANFGVATSFSPQFTAPMAGQRVFTTKSGASAYNAAVNSQTPKGEWREE